MKKTIYAKKVNREDGQDIYHTWLIDGTYNLRYEIEEQITEDNCDDYTIIRVNDEKGMICNTDDYLTEIMREWNELRKYDEKSRYSIVLDHDAPNDDRTLEEWADYLSMQLSIYSKNNYVLQMGDRKKEIAPRA